MAITIHATPPEITPAYNEIRFLVSSSNSGQPNFKYVFDVYATDGTTLLARVKIPARPSDNKGYFDAKRILENLVNYDLPTYYETAGFYQNSNSFYKYTVKIGEEYGATPTVYPDLYVPTAFFNGPYVYNAALPEFERRFYTNDTALYWIYSGELSRCQTNMPTSQRIELGQNASISMICTQSNTIYEGVIKKYDSAGVLLGTITIANPYTVLTDHADKFLRFACGTNNISAHSGGWIDGNVAYYTVYITDSTGYIVTPTYTYTITQNCRFETFRLHFLNTRGGFDSFNFTMKSEKRQSIKRDSFRKVKTDIHNRLRGNTTFNTETEQIHTLHSDWLTEEESAWLEQLAASPEVYIEEYVYGEYLPIDILNTDYALQKKVNQKLFNIALSFKYSVNDNKQRG